MKKFKFRLIYFKESGKYYCDGILEIECETLDNDHNTPYMGDVIEKVHKLRIKGPLPGLIGGWEYSILISEEDSAFPHLITPIPSKSKAVDYAFDQMARYIKKHSDDDEGCP